MTHPIDTDRLVDTFLDEGPNELPDRVLTAVQAEIHVTHQLTQRGLRRFLQMTPRSLAGTGLAAVLTIAAIAVIAGQLNHGSGPAGIAGGPTPSPSSGPNATPTSAPTSASPSPSPAGILSTAIPIVFGRVDATSDLGTIYTISANGTNQRALFSGVPTVVTWSPDGRHLMYAVEQSPTQIATGISDADGSNERTLPVPDKVRSLGPGAWSPDGSEIAFEGWTYPTTGEAGIFIGSATDASGLRQITSRLGPGTDVPWAFSPDGKHLLFVRRSADDASEGDLYVVATDGTGLRKLNPRGVVVSEAFGSPASWSPDGGQIAFGGLEASQAQARQSAVYVIPLSGGSAKAIAEGTWITSAKWSPDGRVILFDAGVLAGNHGLTTVEPDGSSRTLLESTVPLGSCCGQWSADGQWILFQAGADTTANLWVVAADGSNPRQITHDPGSYQSYAFQP
jgi:Tol biopolymer transport system component